MSVVFDWHALEAVLEEVTHPSVLTVEPPGVAHAEPLDHGADRLFT